MSGWGGDRLTVKIWDAATGDELLSWRGKQAHVPPREPGVPTAVALLQ